MGKRGEGMMEIKLNNNLVLCPPKTPINCKHRVWIGEKAHCIHDVKAAIVVTETETTYAPFCDYKGCPLESRPN